MVLVVPGLLAFCFGWLAFRSRVTGVYLSIITQAMTYALLLAFFRNDFGFGGNNGLTDFKDILGFNVQADGTRAALFALSCLALSPFLSSRVVTSKLGKVLIAIRDAEARTRFLGYRVESYKLFVFTLSACMAGVAGALYVPQVGIINPSEFSPANSIEAVIWVAVGRGTLVGPRWRRRRRYAKTYTSGPLAPYWLFMLGALFILVTLLLPKASSAPLPLAHGRKTTANAKAIRRRRRRTKPAGERMVSWRKDHQRCSISTACTSRSTVFTPSTICRRRWSPANARHHRPQRRRQDHDDGHHHRQDQARPGRGAVRQGRYRPDHQG
jgi:urea transport system permease protein